MCLGLVQLGNAKIIIAADFVVPGTFVSMIIHGVVLLALNELIIHFRYGMLIMGDSLFSAYFEAVRNIQMALSESYNVLFLLLMIGNF
jgi:hypothetical protein